MNDIKSTPVRTAEDFETVTKFGATFGQKPCGKFPVTAFHDENGNMVGYVETVNVPVMLISVHPDYPKAAVATLKKLKAWAELQHGVVLAGVEPASPLVACLPKLGMVNTNLNLYRNT